MNTSFEEELQNEKINFKLSTSLKNLLDFKAKASGLDRSKYLKNLIIDSNIQINNYSNTRRLIYECNKIGVNINQISKSINTLIKGNKIDEIDYEDIINNLAIMNDRLEEILNGKES